MIYLKFCTVIFIEKVECLQNLTPIQEESIRKMSEPEYSFKVIEADKNRIEGRRGGVSWHNEVKPVGSGKGRTFVESYSGGPCFPFMGLAPGLIV